MRTISRGIKPKQGKVLLYGNNIFSMKNKHVAKKMSILNQANDTISDANVKEISSIWSLCLTRIGGKV